jgi:hypothetical protein
VIKGIEELTDNYKEFKSMRCPILPPAEPLTLLPPLVQDTDPGMSIQETVSNFFQIFNTRMFMDIA